jgi:DNA-binding response OmpR family regulator
VNENKILVVDDEPKIVETVQAYLEVCGYSVCTAASGGEALARQLEYKPDLIILDLMLPDISGERVCEIIRGFSSTPIIMLTAKSEEESFINGLKIGADDYMMKPFSLKQLAAKVDAILRRASGTRPNGEVPIGCGALTLDNTAHNDPA